MPYGNSSNKFYVGAFKSEDGKIQVARKSLNLKFL